MSQADQNQWTAVDAYMTGLLAPSDPALEAALQATIDAGMPQINVAPNQGKLLQVLARALGARRILEIGTLAGYSTIWLARALPADGQLVTLEIDPQHAAVASANIAHAGLAQQVEVRQGQAIEILPQLDSEGYGPFDLVFIDADKASTTEYFAWALKLARIGSLIIVDNVVRGGAVLDPASTDPSVQGIRRFYQALAAESRVQSTAIQTVGSKGYDGFAIAVVTAV
jgi:predicted O-methyltransferase YrrM